MTFVNPIYMKKECESLAPEESNREMRRNAEISNRVTIIGKVCTPPTLFITDKGQRIANYQLDVMRKYRIKEDQETNKHDFPFVKSYGVVADNDVLAIQEDGMVFVDGAIQTREYLKNHQCPTCGETYQYKDTATEIVPYSTEYLTGCKTMEEIEEELIGIQERFLKVHRNYLVNHRYISWMYQQEAGLMDGTRIPVSQIYRKRIEQAFLSLIHI